jgi:hypothetical protein
LQRAVGDFAIGRPGMYLFCASFCCVVVRMQICGGFKTSFTGLGLVRTVCAKQFLLMPNNAELFRIVPSCACGKDKCGRKTFAGDCEGVGRVVGVWLVDGLYERMSLETGTEALAVFQYL